MINYLGPGLPRQVSQLTDQQRKAMIKTFRFPASIVDDPRRLLQNLHYRLRLHHIAADDLEHARQQALKAQQEKKENQDTEAEAEADGAVEA